jgi:uncharacterized protein YjbI with pentapeptide repeats
LDDELQILPKGSAIDLWKAGKDKWNAWVECNPNALVNFENHPFSSEKTEHRTISFEGYLFPKGGVSFKNANFDGKSIKFSKAIFLGAASFKRASFEGSASLDFSKAIFKENVEFRAVKWPVNSMFVSTSFNGDVDFTLGKFLDCDINFDNSEFNESTLHFTGSTFKDTALIFNGAVLRDSAVILSHTTLESSIIDLKMIKASDSIFDFDKMTMKETKVEVRSEAYSNCSFHFEELNSITGSIDFSDTNLSTCNVVFDNASIDSELTFQGATLGIGRYSFEKAHFHRHIQFSNIINDQQAVVISFKHSTFHSSFDLSDNDLRSVIDLTNTKTTNQVSVSGLKCKLNRKYFCKAINPHDAVCFMRLKEIAASNNDHQSALGFHANEMRAKRWQHEKGLNATVTAYTESLLDTFYGWLCDYGQSILLPVFWFLLCIMICTFKYAIAADKLELVDALPASLMLSISNSIPFLQSSKGVQKETIDILFNYPDSVNIYFWLASQGALSFVFIFLIGLGLRNRFRI